MAQPLEKIFSPNWSCQDNARIRYKLEFISNQIKKKEDRLGLTNDIRRVIRKSL